MCRSGPILSVHEITQMLLRLSIILIVLSTKSTWYLLYTHTWYLPRNAEFCAHQVNDENKYGRFCVYVVVVRIPVQTVLTSVHLGLKGSHEKCVLQLKGNPSQEAQFQCGSAPHVLFPTDKLWLVFGRTAAQNLYNDPIVVELRDKCMWSNFIPWDWFDEWPDAPLYKDLRPFPYKSAIERPHIWYMESMRTSLGYIAT